MELTLQAMKTLSELMDQALDLDEDKRSRWVADLSTGPHAALQPFLADMLARQADMETAFMVKAIALPAASTPTTEAGAATNVLISGARVGPYLLEREVGHGGMGAVWLATRVDGAMTRQVALKLPTVHLTAALAERFDRERDILAQLTHPNIARLYDAGVSETGRPYLALEYVEGKAITEHCDAINLPIPERLRRFLQVASAVQYAHANLVIHRDLKPSNILVSEDGQVHLLDFGIAKLLDGPKGQAADSELTMLAGRALTLDYASPEQVNGSAISTASDVYSIGVVLYLLLTGQKPYQLRRGSRAELEEAILTTDSALMSDAARRGDGATATQRGLSKDRLARALAGDLDTIVAKAMKKDPLQRYTTVAAFAEDIQRHLDGLPVEAQPDSWQYRAGKFVARNRLGVAASLAVVAALATGLGTALWQASVATQQALRADAAATTARTEKTRADAEAQTAKTESTRADEQARAAQTSASRADAEANVARKEAQRADREALAARREAARADQEARLARTETTRGNAVQSYLVDLFSANSNDQKNAIQVRNLNAKQLLDRGAQRLQTSSAQSQDVNAALFRLFGELYENLDELDNSIAFHERGVNAAATAHGRDSKQYALAILELAWVRKLRTPGKPQIALIEEAKAILTRVAPGSEEHAQALYFEAEFVRHSDPPRAAVAARESIRLMDLQSGAPRRKAFALRTLGYAQRSLGNVDAAAIAFEQAIKSFTQLYGADGFEVGITKGDLGLTLRQQLRLAEAEQAARESVEILRAFRGNRVDWEGYGQRLARLVSERGRITDAEKRLQVGYDALVAADSAPSDMTSSIAIELIDIAIARGQFHHAHELVSRHRQGVDGGFPTIYAGILVRAASIALERNELSEARRHVDDAKALLRERGLPLDAARDVAAVAAEVAAAAGDVAQAVAEFADFQARFPLPKHSLLTQLKMDFSKARVFASLKRWSEVDAVLRDWSTKPLLPGQEIPIPLKGEMLLLAGEAAQKMGKLEARNLLTEANEILARMHVPTSAALARSKLLLGQLASAS